MNKLQAIHWFADTVAKEHVVIMRERTEWAMYVHRPYPYMSIPKELNYISTNKWEHEFRKDFCKRYPTAWRFSDVTLSILHEIGHHFTREVFLETDEEEYENARGFDHFKQPCEIAATDWAIKWLKQKENRKIAEQFEEIFFFERK